MPSATTNSQWKQKTLQKTWSLPSIWYQQTCSTTIYESNTDLCSWSTVTDMTVTREGWNFLTTDYRVHQITNRFMPNLTLYPAVSRNKPRFWSDNSSTRMCSNESMSRRWNPQFFSGQTEWITATANRLPLAQQVSEAKLILCTSHTWSPHATIKC